VETTGNVEANKVSIKWISDKGKKFIYKNGKEIKNIGYLYGDYGFCVYYKDSLINHFGHFNSKWNKVNHYKFKISNFNNIITSSLVVIGPDSISKYYWQELFHPYAQDQLKVQQCELSNSIRKNNFKKNLIEVTLRPEDYSKIENNINSKLTLKKASIKINNDSLELKKIKIAGASTLNYRRKSYKISLEKPYVLKDNDSIFQIQNFRLLALSMDPYYYNMYISYRFMKALNLFDLFFTYVQLKMNNETQGIYLLIEEPEYHALKSKESNFVIRRNYNFSSFLPGIENNSAFEFKSNIINSKLTDADYIESLKEIYKILNKYQGKDLYNELDKHVDLNQYTRWMAINYFLCNGDYTDEVFFYTKSTPDNARFELIPWDYDDILRNPPHEGWVYRHTKIGNKLIFSVEDSLDLKIASDEYLYTKYLNSLNLLINTIDENFIKKVFEDACYNIRQYIHDKNILSVSKFDKTPIISEDDFITNIKASYLFLLERRRTISNNLQKMRNLGDIADKNNLPDHQLTFHNN
jgi:spore coat protein H